MRNTVVVIGKGVFAEVVCRELSKSDKCRVVCQPDIGSGVPETAQLIVTAYDSEQTSEFIDADELLWSAGIPWLRGFVSHDEGFVGPFVRPGVTGCSLCADNRRLMAGQHTEQEGNLPQNGWIASASAVSSISSSICGLRHAAHILSAEAQRALQGSPVRLQERIIIVNMRTLASSLHFFQPDPSCPVCANLTDDSSEAARISLHPRLKINAGSYRGRPLNDMAAALGRFVDSRTGLINEKIVDLDSPFASVRMNLPSFTSANEVTAGRSNCYAESELTAVLESLERYCGQVPRGKKSVICGSFNHLADKALDPVKVGLYAKEQYALPDFPFEPFDPDAEMDWVWGYSFSLQRPILVPENIAYYSSYIGGGFVQEGSNGCAVGGSLEEAILYGILEVAERDAFLMTWYARMPVPRLDPGSAGDLELQLMIERLRAVAGYEVHLFNITMENGIPSIWAIGKSVSPGKMNLVCAAGAHLDPVRAAKNAVHELAGMLFLLQRKFEEARVEAERMFVEPSLVRQMEDHVMLYGLSQSEERLQFLLDTNRPLRTFQEMFGKGSPHADLTDDLKGILHMFRQLKLDVIVVDQTSPELMRIGLHCVKVIIPGMLPMTFGHHLKRLAGLERVNRVPVELGYKDRPITDEQLNPHPHPFI